MIDDAAYIKLNNRVTELEGALEKLKGNLTALPARGLTPIETKTAGVAGLASFDFQGISANYSKLIVDLYVRGDAAATNINVRLTYNNDGTSIYDFLQYSIAHSASLGTVEGLAGAFIVVATVAAANAPASTFDCVHIEIPLYANVGGHKVCTSIGTAKLNTTSGTLYAQKVSGWYRSTNAISRVTLVPSSGNFAQYSVAKLYGVL